jgi:hypothetical protein
MEDITLREYMHLSESIQQQLTLTRRMKNETLQHGLLVRRIPSHDEASHTALDGMLLDDGNQRFLLSNGLVVHA